MRIFSGNQTWFPEKIGLLAWGSTLNMMSAIGFIMLMGLVVKNAVLLVDFVNQARKAGMEHSAAIMQAAEVRLRPILMTTLAMIFGMIPMALGLGEGGSQRAGMAHVVIGGLISSPSSRWSWSRSPSRC